MTVSFRALALAFTCLSVAAPAIAAVPSHGIATLSRLPKPHALDIAPVIANMHSSPASTALAETLPFLTHDDANAGLMAAAGDRPAGEPAASMAQTTAASVARDVAGTTGTCDTYFTQSQGLAAPLSTAFPAMASRDIASLSNQLPALDSLLAALPAAEVAPEVCGGNHINAYTTYQFFELSSLRAKGIDIGFPVTLPIVKQPELNQSALAYAVGWIKFEKSDFAGALAAYGKGLTMFPHNHELQSEYIATLLKLNRGPDVVTFAENVLYSTYDLDDAARARLYAARGIGLIFTGQFDQADDSFTVSLRYSYTEEVKGYQDQLRAARANAVKK